MSEENRNIIPREELIDAILQAAAGTVKVMENALQIARMIAGITQEVMQTLRECGVIVEGNTEEIPTGNTRSLSVESKIAQHVCKKLMTSAPPDEPAAAI